MKRLYIFLIAIFFIVYSHAQVLTGTRYRSALESSINILNNNLQILKAHAEEDGKFGYWHLCVKRAPVDILTSDGVIHKGTVERQQMPLGFIGGDETGGFFAGFNADAVVFKMNDVFGYNDEPKRISTGQIMYHAGLELLGIQLQVGSFLNFGGGDLFDGNGDFPAVDAGWVEDESSKLKDAKKRVFTGYHKSGIYFSTIYEKVGTRDPETNKVNYNYEFSEFKFNWQPIKKILPEVLGKPFIDILKLSPLKSYYNEEIVNTIGNLKKISPYEVSFGSDKFLLKGLNIEVTAQIRPTMMFRKTQVSYSLGFGNFIAFGAKGTMYKSNDKTNYSFDALAMIYYLKKVNLTVSYSYNGYDLTTFLPIPYTHAIGIHFLIGNPKTFRFPLTGIEEYIKGDYD